MIVRTGVDVSEQIQPSMNESRPLFTSWMPEITKRKPDELDDETALKANDYVLANMGHELRTPLTAILGYADMLRQTRLTEDHSAKLLDAIRQNGEELLQIVGNVLDLAESNTDSAEIKLALVSPWAVVAQVVADHKGRAKEKALQLIATCDGPFPANVQTSLVRLRQILSSLISNAIKFSTSGRVSIRMWIELSQSEVLDTLCFEVNDDGIGMLPEEIECVFTPFYQADSSHTRAQGGVGLGLWVARRQAEPLKGEIKLESRAGKGSRITVHLPVRFDRSTLIDQSECSGVVSSAFEMDQVDHFGIPRGHVLLAEDNCDTQRVLTYDLQRIGLTLEIAENGRIAIEKGLRGEFDAVLMDIQMPEIDGYAATRALRRGGFTKPIIAITTHAFAGDAEKCLLAGCDDYLRKPIELKNLHQKLCKQLKASTASGDSIIASELDLPPEFREDPAYLELVDDYVQSLPEQIAELDQAVRGRDGERSAKLAHVLRGAGGMYGLANLSLAAGRIEDGVRLFHDWDRIADHLAEVFAILNRLHRELAYAS